MKIIRGASIEFIQAAHEDPKDPGALKKILLKKGDLSPGRVQMINWAKIPVGKSFSSHLHEDMEEVFIVLTGKAEVVVGDETDKLEVGDAVVIPEKHNHVMKNVGNVDIEYIVIGITRNQAGKTVVQQSGFDLLHHKSGVSTINFHHGEKI